MSEVLFKIKANKFAMDMERVDEVLPWPSELKL